MEGKHLGIQDFQKDSVHPLFWLVSIFLDDLFNVGFSDLMFVDWFKLANLSKESDVQSCFSSEKKTLISRTFFWKSERRNPILFWKKHVAFNRKTSPRSNFKIYFWNLLVCSIAELKIRMPFSNLCPEFSLKHHKPYPFT